MSADERARALMYPLAYTQQRLHRLMLRTAVGSEAGRLAVEAHDSLRRAERIARTLYTFDPTGL